MEIFKNKKVLQQNAKGLEIVLAPLIGNT